MNPTLNFTQICVFNISLLFSVISQKMQFGPIHIATWGSTQPCVTLWTLNIVPVSLFMAEHRWHLMLALHKPASVVN